MTKGFTPLETYNNVCCPQTSNICNYNTTCATKPKYSCGSTQPQYSCGSTYSYSCYVSPPLSDYERYKYNGGVVKHNKKLWIAGEKYFDGYVSLIRITLFGNVIRKHVKENEFKRFL